MFKATKQIFQINKAFVIIKGNFGIDLEELYCSTIKHRDFYLAQMRTMINDLDIKTSEEIASMMLAGVIGQINDPNTVARILAWSVEATENLKMRSHFMANLFNESGMYPDPEGD